MTKQKSAGLKILPVMFGFFIMGFIDVIGIATSYIKNDFAGMSDTVANLISLSCFFWFLILSIPTGIMLNKLGRKNTVIISFVIHGLALIVPFLNYDFTSILICFGLIGIGNTMLQVALNPLVTNVVAKERLAGSLTFGQFVKAISSLSGPVLAAWLASSVFGWRMLFPVYAGFSLLGALWLLATRIPQEDKSVNEPITLKSVYSLLADKYILTFFIAILVLVGVDVGMNITFPKFLMQDCGLELGKAGLGNSVYFFARTIGAFAGGLMMMKFAESKFYRYSVFIALAGLLLMLVSTNLPVVFAGVFLFGLGYANLFSIIFSLALKYSPGKENEVSALLIVGVSGGAILPPLLGIITDIGGTQQAGIAGLAVVWFYMVWLIKKVQSIGTATNKAA
ncbi:MFS transporter [Niabella aquatica]